ncbi:MAG TPA: hypothetical protein VKV18_10855 [Chthonomonas sp.]|uniref:hypothetical protein n=1 Tax=Chthonomonas sp. TaxID=2282153 RepID=UPI002B4B3D08|nr:hypothetical protein [Chthonomonas sp.]HLI49174.1 hypothetical protein [Chthonomonas sp.]
MILLYMLNLLLWLGLLILPPLYFTFYFRLNRINLLTIYAFFTIPPQIVTTLTGPLFLLRGGLFNPYFQYALIVQNVHDSLTFAALIFFVHIFSHQRMRDFLESWLHLENHPARPGRMRLAADIFYGLFLVCFVLLARHDYGVIPWILNPRMGYQFHRTGAGEWYALCITFLALATVLGTIYTSSLTAFFTRLPLYLFGVYLLGSKGYIISYTAYLLSVLAIRRFRYLGVTFVLLTSVSLLLFVYNFTSSMHGLNLMKIATYSDYFVNDAMYYQRYLNGQIPLYHGEIFFSSFWRIVPRALYPNKPYSYGIILIDDIFYPGEAQKGFTPAFASVPYFADFGWIGVVLSGLLNPATVLIAFLYTIVFPRINTLNLRQGYQHPRVLLYALLIVAAPAFLAFFDFPLDALFFGFIVLVIEIICKLKILYAHHSQQIRTSNLRTTST